MQNNYIKIKPNKTLPLYLVIGNAGNHFYEIGLWQFMIGNAKRNILYFKPIFTLICVLILCARSIISILTKEENDEFFVKIGDTSYFLNVRYQANMCLILILFAAIMNQVIHYYNYKHNIYPSYIKVFEMMAGFVSPQSIGLNDDENIRQLINKSRYLFKVISFNTNILLPILVLVVAGQTK